MMNIMNAVFEYNNPMNKLTVIKVSEKFNVSQCTIYKYAKKYRKNEKFRKYYEIMHKKTFAKIMSLKKNECETVDEDGTCDSDTDLDLPISEGKDIIFDENSKLLDAKIAMEILDPNFSLLVD